MPRSRVFLVTLILVAVGFLAGPAMADDAEVQALAQRVQALETRVATLERTLAQRFDALEKKLAQGGGGGAAMESEAQAAYSNISRLANTGEYEKARDEMADFMKKYGNTQTAARARRLHQELSVIGKPVPTDWGIDKWYQGEKDIDLKSGKTTLLVFFEEWCPHCKREVPKLQQFYTDLKGDGLQVVGFTKITRSATDEKVQAFITDRHIGYPIAKENGSLSRHFNVSGIPAAAVIKDGKVVWRGHPAQLNEVKLKAWL